MTDDRDPSPGERLAAQLSSLPALYVGLLDACIDPTASADENVGQRRGGKGDPLAAPLELNLTILDFLAEPSEQGRLGMTRSVLSMAAVTRAAFGGSAPDGYDRHVAGVRYLAELGVHLDDATPERLVEVAAVAESVQYLARQAERIRDGAAWTTAAAAHVSTMYDEATVGLDYRIYERYNNDRSQARDLLAGETELNPWMALEVAVMAFAMPREEYVGLTLDAVRHDYRRAAAGAEQWGDWVAEEVYRLHHRAEQLLDQVVDERGRAVDVASCPFCGSYQLMLISQTPRQNCSSKDSARDRCCGDFLRCVGCARSWSLNVDRETGRSEASVLFGAFRAGGWLPQQRTAEPDLTERQLRASA